MNFQWINIKLGIERSQTQFTIQRPEVHRHSPLNMKPTSQSCPKDISAAYQYTSQYEQLCAEQ